MPTSWEIMEPYWNGILLSDPVDYPKVIAAVPCLALHLVTSTLMDAEVCNGGFYQFLWNGSGMVGPEAVAGLRAIGCLDLAEIADEAMARMPNPFPRETGARRSFLDAHRAQFRLDASREKWDPFWDLDERYYAAVDSLGAGGSTFVKAVEVYAARAG